MFALLLAAALAVAEDDAELARTVEALVRDLAASSAETRTLARFRLASYGDKIRPLLERVDSDDPEVRRAIRRLTRTAGKVEMELLPRSEPTIRIGAPLVLEVRIINNTELTYALLPDVARQGGAGPFRIRVGGKTLLPVGIDQVNWGTDGLATILPGASRRFRLDIGGASSPLRRPALYDVSVVFDGRVGRGFFQDDGGGGAIETVPLVLESEPIQVHVLGRKADELEKALRSDDAREREAAAKELALRDDEAILPILRRQARARPLRLAAVTRLGALGAAEDFDLVYEAVSDESAEVRRAAVLGLANYRSWKARSRLLRLASDHELHAEAIQALGGHKHHATIDCYVRLLEGASCDPKSIDFIRARLLEWTGLAVANRRSEIEAFRDWWWANREDWARKNASGR